MSRTFLVKQDVTVNRTVTWQVEADSFEEAEERVYDGYGEWYDSDDWDEDYGSIDSVECECGETDPDDCECESSDTLVDLGL